MMNYNLSILCPVFNKFVDLIHEQDACIIIIGEKNRKIQPLIIEPSIFLLNLYGTKVNGSVIIQDKRAVLFPQYFLHR